MNPLSLRITEIFYSLQGESRSVGRPTVFVRLTGCPLRCQYCDTEYAFHGGSQISIDAILVEVASFACRHVTVTGGEPLAQPQCLDLLRLLCDQGYEVSLETSGALPIDKVDARVSKVMDLKTPGSAEQSRNLWSNLGALTRLDQVKFVLCARADYEWAKEQLLRHDLAGKVDEVLLSPSWGQMDPVQFADWVLADRLPMRVQLQLHKVLWGGQAGK